MNRRSFLCSSAALVGVNLPGSESSQLEQTHPHHTHSAPLMTECANRFLAALDPNQRSKATFPFDSDERMNWHFIPRKRKGLPLREIAPNQKRLASAFLAAGGDPHYYRVQSPSSLIELDDTQDNANHIHSVWRDFTGDLGADLLQQHYQSSHKQNLSSNRR